MVKIGLNNINFLQFYKKNDSKATDRALKFQNVAYKSKTYKILKKTPITYKNGEGYIYTFYKKPKYQDEAIDISTVIKNNKNSKIGYYEYTLNKSTNTINNGYIETVLHERRNGIGEILRLSSIIELRENGIKNIDIEALNRAVPFHLKYKFKSNLTTKDYTLKILENIYKNDKVLPYYKQKAKELIHKIEPTKTISLDKEIGKIVNKFIENFVKQHTHNWKQTNFLLNLPMKLTETELKQFANFYNKLFKKHGINYKL